MFTIYYVIMKKDRTGHVRKMRLTTESLREEWTTKLGREKSMSAHYTGMVVIVCSKQLNGDIKKRAGRYIARFSDMNMEENAER